MNLLDLPVRRPVAVTMVFLGIALLGVVAWQRIPVELMPALQGNSLYVSFGRAGAEPELIEREMLLPLDAKVAGLPLVAETGGQVYGSSGEYWVRFEPGGDIKVRELELRRVAAAIERQQPRGTAWVRVSSTESFTAAFGSFVMQVHVLGGSADRNALYDLTDQLLTPRFAAVPGVSEAITSGGARRQVTVRVDPQRAAAVGVTATDVVQAVSRNVRHINHAGSTEAEVGRTGVLVDGRLPGLHALGEAYVLPGGAAKVRHVAEVEYGVAPNQSEFRINGEPAVAIAIYQEEGTNLIRLGQTLRERVDDLRAEVAALGLDLVIGVDASEGVEEQMSHLAKRGLSGYLIALVVLFLFLREWRAVAVVGVAVPVSLLGTLALLYVFDQTLNIISLIGLSLSVGLLIDNSIVVYEAVLRRLERGMPPAGAARAGVRRTARAIAAASLTTAVVFVPLLLIDLNTTTRAIVEILGAAILLPLAVSLLVAIGLVPMLAHRLAAPAAQQRVASQRARRDETGGLRAPDPIRILFSGLLANALRRPSAMLTGVIFAVLITLFVAVPGALSISQNTQAEIADEVQLEGRFAKSRSSIAALGEAVGHVEQTLLGVDGVKDVFANLGEEGASITVRLVDLDERPASLTVSRVREIAQRAAKQVPGFELLRPGEQTQRGKGGGRGGRDGGMAEVFGGGPNEIVLSGPETAPLRRLASDVVVRLESVPSVQRAWHWARPGMEEIWVEPNRRAFEAFGLTLDEVLPVLQLAGREGTLVGNGLVTASGREIPVAIERTGAREPSAVRDLRRLRLHTTAGAAPVSALATIRQMPPPPMISHHNGRREMSVYYRLADVPNSDAARESIDREIAAVLHSVPRSSGYTAELKENDEQTEYVRKAALPAILLLLLVLAMVFESLTLPLLVLLALPLTLLGATWLLLLTGTPVSLMTGAGIFMLVGITVNPAILLVDRMQRKIRAGWSAGAAALASVRERTRPVLMTSATTIAALWPLALVTGRENEIWPPFATVVIGGLITSTLLTLLVIPVGFILLQRLDRLFGRVGPWLVVGWLAATLAAMLSLTLSELVTSLLWQTVTSLLVGSALLAIVVLLFRRPELVEPDVQHGPPSLDVRNLRKVYGLPGPLRRAITAPREFVRQVVARGGAVAGVGDFAWADVVRRFGPSAILVVAPFAIATQVNGGGWKLILWFVGAAFAARLLADIRRARGRADAAGVVEPGGVSGALQVLTPWLVLAAFTFSMVVRPRLAGDPQLAATFWPIIAALLLGAGQLMRLSAVRQQRGLLPERATAGPLRYPRTMLRRWARRLGGLDLPTQPVQALSAVNFVVGQGMVGILGPNGAGKTTLLRQLAGILDPTRGTIALGGVPLGKVRRVLARWVGYLPQDAGLPGGLSPREYLSYFAALYDLAPQIRRERVETLLREVGLEEKADAKIKSLSGGQRQRVAVARTLLRLPPVIIVDEPTVGLDPRERIRFRNLLTRLAQERIVLFSTHVVEDVAASCERVLVFAAGRLVFDGEPAALADAATGRVWETSLPYDAEFMLPAGAILAEEAPVTATGDVVRRIVAETAPSSDARPLPARLEDGYLWLISGPAEPLGGESA